MKAKHVRASGWVLGVILFAVTGTLSACGSDYGTPDNDTQDKRYTKCLESGGSFWTEGDDWGCDMDGISSHG